MRKVAERLERLKLVVRVRGDDLRVAAVVECHLAVLSRLAGLRHFFLLSAVGKSSPPEYRTSGCRKGPTNDNRRQQGRRKPDDLLQDDGWRTDVTYSVACPAATADWLAFS
jgi:hypothetical protein